jgi:hypothetical protein
MNSNIVTYLHVQIAEKFKSEPTVDARTPGFGNGYRNKPLLRGADEQEAHGMRFGPGGHHIRPA